MTLKKECLKKPYGVFLAILPRPWLGEASKPINLDFRGEGSNNRINSER